MKNHLNKIAIFLFVVACININVCALAEDKSPNHIQEADSVSEEDAVTGPKWTESLRLRDITLLEEAFESNRKKLETYKDTIAKEYEKIPDAFSSAISYGLVLIDLHEFDKAKKVWDKAVKDFIANPTPLAYKGWVDACNGNYGSAKESLYPTLLKGYDDVTGKPSIGVWLPCHVHSVLGLYLIKDKFPENEKNDIEKMVLQIAKTFKKKPEYGVILISDDLQHGRLKSAEAKLDKLLEKNPNEPILLTLKGITELFKGNYQDSITLFDKSSEKSPSAPTNHLMKARALYESGDKKQSKKILEKAFDLDPTLSFGNNKEKFLLSESYLVPLEKTLSEKLFRRNAKDKFKELKSIKESKETQEAKVPKSDNK